MIEINCGVSYFMKRLVGFFIIASLLSGCGFHLRGTSEDKIEIKELAVSAGDRYGPLVKELRERLADHGVKIYDTAMYKLVITSSIDSRTLAFSSSIRGTDIEQILTLKYRIYGVNNLLLVEDTVEARGQYVSDINNIVADELQKNRLDQELRGNAITLLIYRLQSISPAKLEELQQKAQEQKRLQDEAKQQRQKAAEERRKLLLQSIPLDEIEQLNSQ